MSNYRLIALTASSAIFMQFLDSTALNTALPSMARDLHVPATDMNVAILSYQLSMAALIPAGSALADRIGPRRAFVMALMMFLCGSVLCALSRSLTALAYLFAVFRARPSPFYVMDEVEAALDDVNLHRFLDLVHEFRREAQLVIVSHQKRTMEAADCLYGVSMAGNGVSKVVSRKLPREVAAA